MMSPTDERPDCVDGSKVDIHATITTTSGADVSDLEECTNEVNVTMEIEENVNKSTPGIVKAYLGEIPESLRSSLTEEIKCAEKLRYWGDVLNDRIEEAFNPLRQMNVASRYEQFIRIARRVFSRGITWGRVAILFALALKYIHLCGRECVEQMMGFLMSFITRNLLHWIIESGGWTALITDEVLPRLPRVTHERMAILALGTCCIAMVTYIMVTKPKQT